MLWPQCISLHQERPRETSDTPLVSLGLLAIAMHSILEKKMILKIFYHFFLLKKKLTEILQVYKIISAPSKEYNV